MTTLNSRFMGRLGLRHFQGMSNTNNDRFLVRVGIVNSGLPGDLALRFGDVASR